VDHRPELVVPIARDDDRLVAHPGGEVLPGLRYLALMAEEQPATHEDAFHLELVNLFVPQDSPADHPALAIDELSHIHGHRCHSYPVLVHSTAMLPAIWRGHVGS